MAELLPEAVVAQMSAVECVWNSRVTSLEYVYKRKLHNNRWRVTEPWWEQRHIFIALNSGYLQ